MRTHSADCWTLHHECAVARIEKVRELLDRYEAAFASELELPHYIPVAVVRRALDGDDGGLGR